MTHRESELLDAFVGMAALLVARVDTEVLSQALADRCVDILDVVDAAVLMADESGELTIAAATSDRCRTTAEHEVAAGEGPSTDAYSRGEVVTIASAATAYATWTTFSVRAALSGYASWVSFPLRVGDRVIGTLSLYRDATEPMTPLDLRAAQALAYVTTVGVLQERALRDGTVTRDQLQRALTSRVLIEQAKGKLSHSLETTPEAAFVELRRRARSSGRRLVDVASEVMEQATITDGEEDDDRDPLVEDAPA